MLDAIVEDRYGAATSSNSLFGPITVPPLPHIGTTIEESESPTYCVIVSKNQVSYCVGIIDMVNSTKLAATMGMKKMSAYYQTFLNLTAKIIGEFGGRVIKNIGDCLLFYFPSTVKVDLIEIKRCFDCALALCESHSLICAQLAKDGLPCVDYRISLDYGPVIPMKSNNSKTIDMIGPAVNMCSKINRCAAPNGIVIGGDLYEIGRQISWCILQEVKGYSVGFKQSYPVYRLLRTK
ncbi:adenylate/guanylate cyclase domain-containing protein [Candidatus Nitrosotenuis cloacae]|uniref:adenylate/guanylate cyclase domain-containing protein n=1 Tax=Candidatus Nitrosotenuis cloacae TaxID=1603555 RepID=UPI00227FCE41|nr:adenylate/guanylate cyclase domain-containing protein [Candidatus Nitrosotenuis cloacae]